MADTRVLDARLRLAADVIDKLDHVAKFTPANRGMARVTDAMHLTRHNVAVNQVYRVWLDNPNMGDRPNATVIAHTISSAHGNCDMKAEVAFNLIRNGHELGYPDTKVLRASIPGHAFCILCSRSVEISLGTTYRMAHFGKDAVICDGWQSDFYAPNAERPGGPMAGPERRVWRWQIAHRPITISRTHIFKLR